jgi:hypothetical protein
VNGCAKSPGGLASEAHLEGRPPGNGFQASPLNEGEVLFLLAFFSRLAVFFAASAVYHIPISNYGNKGDGASYIAYARAILGDPSTLTEYDRRVFPGYPALIAAVHLTGVSFPLAGLLVDWISAGVAAAMAGRLFPDRRVAWAMIFLIPHYLMNSSLVMSEAPLLAFTLAGLVAVLERQVIVGAVLLGLAGLIRPMACFAVVALVISLALDRRWRQAMLSIVIPLAVVSAGMLLMHAVTGDALRGVKVYRDSPQAYVGRIFEWPFYSLLTTPRADHASAWLMLYIYLHVAVVMLAIFVLSGRVRSTDSTTRSLDQLALAWLIGNTLFQLCIGSSWGFRHFPRFAIPAQPALFWALYPYVPRQKWIWLAAGAGVFALSVAGVNACP